MNKSLSLLLAVILTTSCVAFGAKYTVSPSGTVKDNFGTIMTSPANVVNQNFYNYVPNRVQSNTQSTVPANAPQSSQQTINYFNNFQAENYISSNQVNS